MNSKRQTVWLVSMLSLMVVLSAYYLFTEDTGQFDMTTGDFEGEDIIVDTHEMPPSADGNNAAPAGREEGQTDKETMASAGGQAKTDAQVIQQLQNQAKSGADFFEAELLKRNEQLSRQTEQLMKVITDAKASSDAVMQATREMNLIQEQQTKISNLEDALAKDFRHAIVTREGSDKWKVIVQSDKLEKSQVVSIIDRAIDELGIGQNQISVQYVP